MSAASASAAIRPCRLLMATLKENGPQTRDVLWQAVKDRGIIKSKAQMKRVLDELVLRDVVNAKVDVKTIKQMAPKKHLPAKQTPSYIFKFKGEPRYNVTDADKATGTTTSKKD